MQRDDFSEFVTLRARRSYTAKGKTMTNEEEAVLMLKHAQKRWPKIEKYWPRIRRRICSACGSQVDLSEPRLLVCGGCGRGRGVGRYCSPECQRVHWPTHMKTCAMTRRSTWAPWTEAQQEQQALQYKAAALVDGGLGL